MKPLLAAFTPPRSKASTITLLGLGLALPACAARASRSLLGSGFRAVTDLDPPRNPASPEVRWKDAILWTLLTGVVGGLARLAVRRALAATQIPSEGHDFEEQAEKVVP